MGADKEWSTSPPFGKGSQGMGKENKGRFWIDGWKGVVGLISDFSQSLKCGFGPFVLLLISIFVTHSVLAQTNSSINFTKKEIAFFKWGTGANEVGIGGISQEDVNKDTQNHKKINKETGEVVPETSGLKAGSFIPQTRLKIDGNDNVYFADSINNRIFVVSSDGSLIRTINGFGRVPYFDVDETGNVFSSQVKRGDPNGLTCIKPNGEKIFYKDFRLGHIENGVLYGSAADEAITTTINGNKSIQPLNKAITIIDTGNNEEKLPPRLFSGPGGDFYGGDQDKEIVIDTRKINQHLKKIGNHIDVEKIEIKVEKKPKLSSWSDVLGVDDIGNVYIFCSYKDGYTWRSKVVEAYIDVYSPTGARLARISDSFSNGGYSLEKSTLGIDIKGNLFRILSSDNGVHIIEWVKN
jgi:hypothetical protein